MLKAHEARFLSERALDKPNAFFEGYFKTIEEEIISAANNGLEEVNFRIESSSLGETTRKELVKFLTKALETNGYSVKNVYITERNFGRINIVQALIIKW